MPPIARPVSRTRTTSVRNLARHLPHRLSRLLITEIRAPTGVQLQVFGGSASTIAMPLLLIATAAILVLF